MVWNECKFGDNWIIIALFPHPRGLARNLQKHNCVVTILFKFIFLMFKYSLVCCITYLNNKCNDYHLLLSSCYCPNVSQPVTTSQSGQSWCLDQLIAPHIHTLYLYTSFQDILMSDDWWPHVTLPTNRESMRPKPRNQCSKLFQAKYFLFASEL